jgi:hypothetical protein
METLDRTASYHKGKKSRTGKRRFKRRPDKNADRRALLQRVIRLLLGDGADPDLIDAIVLDETRRARRRGKGRRISQLGSEHWAYIQDVSHVATVWHTDPQYLIGQMLRPLNHAELTTLVTRVLPDDDPQNAIQTMLRIKTIDETTTEDGEKQYICNGRVIRVREPESALATSLYAIAALATTLHDNLCDPDSVTRPFELKTVNPRFPLDRLPEARDKSRERGRAILHEMDNWLHLHELPPDSRKRSTRFTFGVYTSMGIGPPLRT